MIEEGLKIYGVYAASTLAETLRDFLSSAQLGDHIAIMAYLTENDTRDETLKTLRLKLRDVLHVATKVGYGPRFLHSTGQYHNGEPNTGLYLQLTADPTVELAIPDAPYSFAVFRQVQALDDLQALQRHDRCVMRIHLGNDVHTELNRLLSKVTEALKLESV